MQTKTKGGPAPQLQSPRSNARFASTHRQAATAASNATEGDATVTAGPDEVLHHLQAKAATDPTVTARLLQCFVRNGLIPHRFLATVDHDGELIVEIWLRPRDISPDALNRILANIGALVGIVSVKLTNEFQPPYET